MGDPNIVPESIENLDESAIQAEEEALKTTPENELREQVIVKYGLDSDANPELIDQLVSDKLEEQKRLSTAIKQKRTWREKAKQIPDKPIISSTAAKPDEIVKAVDAVLERRELEDLELGDELKREVQNYAKLNSVSIKKALSSDYISFLKEKEEKKQKIEDASLGNKGRAPSKKDYDNMTASDFDLKTPEGKAEFTKWEDHLRKQLG